MAKIQPGLERIAALLKGATFPWKSIHVAGTNGKGSVCNYASSMLVGRSIKVGKLTSPHLVDRWDCITINGKSVEESKFRRLENHYLQMNKKLDIGASPFEILTATAFACFNDANVKVGVVEVGMGGKLDSTNILNNQAVSVITKIARDHEGFLGNTLSEIAGHKAGILRPHVPYIINAANEANVQAVIDDYAQSIGGGPRLLSTSFELDARLYGSQKWQRVTQSLLPFQQENLKLAVVAVMQVLENLDKGAKPTELAKTLLLNAKRHHNGRQEMIHAIPVFKEATKRRNHVLVDGAHNPDAAEALNEFVQTNLRFGQSPTLERPASGWPVTWVLAMTEGKDARQYLAALLKPGDNVVTTTFGPVDGMPWVKSMNPKELLEIAKSVEPKITGVHVPVLGALRALCTAKYLSNQMASWAPIALTGSLYLVGDLHRELRRRSNKTWWSNMDEATVADRESFLKVQAEERERVDAVLKSKGRSAPSEPEQSASEEQGKIQEELEALNREVQGLEIEEKRLVKDHSATLDLPDGGQSLSAVERLELEDRRFAELHSTPEQIAAYFARAEKAKADLARHALKLEAEAKAREERKEKRLKQKQRAEERRERKAERRKPERELKEQRRDRYLGYEKLPQLLNEGEQKEMDRRQERDRPSRRDAAQPDAAFVFNTERNKVFSFSGARADAGRKTWTPMRNAESEDVLSALSNRDQKNSFFSKSDSSTASNSKPAKIKPAPSAQKTENDMSAEELRELVRQLKSEEQAASKAELAAIVPARDQESSSGSAPRAATSSQAERRARGARSVITRRQGPKIHMHYAHVTNLRTKGSRSVPGGMKTKAWLHAKGGKPGYHTPIKYYRYDLPDERKGGE